MYKEVVLQRRRRRRRNTIPGLPWAKGKNKKIEQGWQYFSWFFRKLWTWGIFIYLVTFLHIYKDSYWKRCICMKIQPVCVWTLGFITWQYQKRRERNIKSLNTTPSRVMTFWRIWPKVQDDNCLIRTPYSIDCL